MDRGRIRTALEATMAKHEPETGTLEGDGAPRLFYRWHPAAEPRAAVVVVHGLAEHSGRYVHVFDALNAHGCDALGLDLRGHGHSAGTRVYVDRWSDYLDDVDRAIAEVRARRPGTAVFVVGHSMGGLVAAHHALARGAAVTGYILSSPGLKPAVRIPGWKDALGKFMSKVWPKLSIPTGIGPELISKDPEVVAAYVADPLVTTNATARWYTEFVRAEEAALARAAELTRPFLMLLGEADRLTDPAGGRALFAGAGAADKTLETYPGLFPEVFNEPERDQVLADVGAWLDARCG
ncbi:MAG: hypothetical protein CVU23_10640 [Betaproteobacteria bacterium HGW-Betaproteobacteria-17]|nr:MAG: hypothetical protein CVU23_10640 [Betaproteobacteria bacterium HGW-Betaproteobacteria-17]